MLGELGITKEHDTMLKYFVTDDEFMPWHGWVADYLHAFRSLSAVEISNDGSLYNPLEANLKEVSNISIANTYIETTLDISKDPFYEAKQLGYSKHHDNECSINAFVDHYKYTLMKNNKRSISTQETSIVLMGTKEKYFIK